MRTSQVSVRPWRKADLAVVGLVASLAVALLLRLYGIHWGLPDSSHPTYSYHPDEALHIATARLLVTGPLLEKHFQYGGTFYYSILNAYFYFAGLLSGALGQGNQLADAILLGRYFLVGVALLTVVLVYEVGRSLFSKPVGALAAFLLAIDPAHIVWAQRVRPDEIAALIVVLVVYLAVRILQSDSAKNMKWFMYAGLILGAAAALRFPLATFGVAPVTAWLLRDGSRGIKSVLRRLWDRRIAAMLAGGLVGYAVASPHSLFNPEYLIAGVRRTLDYEAEPFADAVGMGPRLYQHGWLMMRQALGTPMYWFALGGVVLGAVRRTPAQLLLLAALVPYFVLTTFASWVVVRYALPIVPILMLSAASLVAWTWEAHRRFRVPTTVLVCGVVIWTLMADIAYLKVEAGLNVQDAAARWFTENIPTGALTVTVRRYSEDQYFTPPIPAGYERYGFMLTKSTDSEKFFRDYQFDYLILHEFIYKSAERLGPLHPRREIYEFQQTLSTGRCRLTRQFKQPVSFLGIDFSDNFSSHDYSIVNPGIRIYRCR